MSILIQKVLTQKHINVFSCIIRRLLLSWLLSATLTYMLLLPELRTLSDMSGLCEMSFTRFLLFVVITFCILCLLSRRFKTLVLERWGILITFIVLSTISLCASFTISFLSAVLLIIVILIIYAIRGRNAVPSRMVGVSENSAFGLTITICFATLFFAFVSIWTVYRVYSFSAPTYDFGIFSQMFHSMRTTGLPNTTLERDGLLSHFYIHISPIYYLLLPLYCLSPAPATLQILQAAVLTSAVIPLWKLAKEHGLSPLARSILCLLLLLYPAYSGGASYDLHENAFLTPLILWLFYAIDRRISWAATLFAFLTSLVKEDAAVYVAVISLWLLLHSALSKDDNRRWGLMIGIITLIGSIIWFSLVTWFLSKYGDGVMTYRYNNFIYDDSSSLFTIIKATMMSPMKIIYECVDKEKLIFIAYTFLPLGGLPILTRRYEHFILLIPYLLVNLMPDYQYQHDIFFQYTYGSTAFLFYLTLVNFEDLSLRKHKPFLDPRPLILILTLLISAVCFSTTVVPKAMYHTQYYWNNHAYFAEIKSFFNKIPDDASVTATTFYTVPLSEREILYDIGYASKEHLLSTEYIVLETNNKSNYSRYATNNGNGYDNLITLLTQNGYVLYAEFNGMLVMYRKIP